jgi:AcrR family transcriptional regulator
MYAMAKTVNSGRRYDARQRREQALQNRSAILQAAHRLFLDQGYAGTTIPDVAEASGLSVETIYKAFGNKPGLLKAAVDVAIVGDDAPVPMLERDLVQRIEAEPDAHQKLSMYGEHLAESAPRHAPLQLLTRSAAASDKGAAKAWDAMQAERLRGMTEFARHLYESKALRAGMSLDEARDIIWTLQSAEMYDLLVIQRGWAPKRYGRWVAETMASALLPPGRGGANPAKRR